MPTIVIFIQNVGISFIWSHSYHNTRLIFVWFQWKRHVNQSFFTFQFEFAPASDIVSLIKQTTFLSKFGSNRSDTQRNSKWLTDLSQCIERWRHSVKWSQWTHLKSTCETFFRKTNRFSRLPCVWIEMQISFPNQMVVSFEWPLIHFLEISLSFEHLTFIFTANDERCSQRVGRQTLEI